MQFCNWILKHTSFFYDSESKVKKENISTKKIKSLNFIEYFANNSNDIEKALNDSYNILSKGEILKEKIYFLFVLASLCELCNIDFKKHLNNKDELFFTLMPLFIIKDKTSYYRDLCKDIFLLFPHALTIIGTLSKDSIIETINSLYTTTNTDAVCSMIEKNPEIILYPFINIIEILENIKPANLNWISNPLDKKNSNTSYLELLWKLLDNRKKCQSEEIRILYIKELLVPFIQDIIKHETSFQTNNSNIIENYITKTQNHVYKKIEAFHNNSSDKGKKKILAEQRIKPFYSLKRLRELLKKRIMAKGPTKKILWNFLHTKLKKKSSLQEIAVQFKFFSKLQKVLIKLPKHFIWYRENQMEQLKNFTLKTVCCTKNSRFHNCENNFMNIDKLSLLFQKNGSSIFFKSPKNKIRFLMVGNREDLVQLILMRHAARFPLLQDIRSKIQIPLAWKQYEEEYFTREKNNR